MPYGIPVTTDERVAVLMAVLSDGQPRTKEELLAEANMYPYEFTSAVKKKMRALAEKEGMCIPWTQNNQPWILMGGNEADDAVYPEKFAFAQIRGTQKSQKRMYRFIQKNTGVLSEENKIFYEKRAKADEKIKEIYSLLGSLRQDYDEMAESFI